MLWTTLIVVFIAMFFFAYGLSIAWADKTRLRFAPKSRPDIWRNLVAPENAGNPVSRPGPWSGWPTPVNGPCPTGQSFRDAQGLDPGRLPPPQCPGGLCGLQGGDRSGHLLSPAPVFRYPGATDPPHPVNGLCRQCHRILFARPGPGNEDQAPAEPPGPGPAGYPGPVRHFHGRRVCP